MQAAGFSPNRRTALGLIGTALALPAAALPAALPVQAQEPRLRPRLDVPYVPTPQEVVDRMLDMAKVTGNDFVMDLGCGDGRMLVTAAKKFGTAGFGVDINPERILEANENAKTAGVADKVTFEVRNLFDTPIGKASVLTMYLLPDVNLKLRPRILQEMKPGSRIVSHAFMMGDWEPDQRGQVGVRDFYFWVVPAPIEGKWTVREGNDNYTLDLKQKYQTFDGLATVNGAAAKVTGGQLIGDRIRFTLEPADGRHRIFLGKVDGDAMRFDMAAATDVAREWSATRTK
ncbi:MULTISPECIES: class I SAM-dependent methyltransferase [unclassified Beijerinckia]|uniref:class I SAM-dependent methyltransferase n=1 Tax=unclassified Beijerinckia TaxID=2638183 RepID=UPI000894EE30|nr:MULTISPECIES: class I SAM-dependent methyltransferase [unclassified Beijerinckia]MDH7799788.1 SAM-dependent methyltransferase [Beijerinckia sp. GAS462]SED37480.1 Methyltransferase domain-containing protein [Beijerinckia sp. 28-YEA-48]